MISPRVRTRLPAMKCQVMRKTEVRKNSFITFFGTLLGYPNIGPQTRKKDLIMREPLAGSRDTGPMNNYGGCLARHPASRRQFFGPIVRVPYLREAVPAKLTNQERRCFNGRRHAVRKGVSSQNGKGRVRIW